MNRCGWVFILCVFVILHLNSNYIWIQVRFKIYTKRAVVMCCKWPCSSKNSIESAMGLKPNLNTHCNLYNNKKESLGYVSHKKLLTEFWGLCWKTKFLGQSGTKCPKMAETVQDNLDGRKFSKNPVSVIIPNCRKLIRNAILVAAIQPPSMDFDNQKSTLIPPSWTSWKWTLRILWLFDDLWLSLMFFLSFFIIFD